MTRGVGIIGLSSRFPEVAVVVVVVVVVAVFVVAGVDVDDEDDEADEEQIVVVAALAVAFPVVWATTTTTTTSVDRIVAAYLIAWRYRSLPRLLLIPPPWRRPCCPCPCRSRGCSCSCRLFVVLILHNAICKHELVPKDVVVVVVAVPSNVDQSSPAQSSPVLLLPWLHTRRVECSSRLSKKQARSDQNYWTAFAPRRERRLSKDQLTVSYP